MRSSALSAQTASLFRSTNTVSSSCIRCGSRCIYDDFKRSSVTLVPASSRICRSDIEGILSPNSISLNNVRNCESENRVIRVFYNASNLPVSGRYYSDSFVTSSKWRISALKQISSERMWYVVNDELALQLRKP